MVDINNAEFLARIEDKNLLSKVCDAKKAAEFFKDGDAVGISGFTPSGYPKITMHELAQRMLKTPFKIDVWGGASTGSQIDEEIVEAGGMNMRIPYQTGNAIRSAINKGAVKFADIHLSHVAQQVRAGFYAGKNGPDVAVIEACKITKDGIYPTTAIGNSPVFVSTAKKVIVEINISQPLELAGMADIFELPNAPHRKPIPLTKASDRLGTPFIPVDPAKIVAIVPCDLPDVTREFSPLDEASINMGKNLVEFLKNEVKLGRLPANLLPLQSGVGNVANALINGLVNSHFSDLSVYTEVIQDGMFDLIDAGKVSVVSGSSLSPSPTGLKRFYDGIDKYKNKIILRPQEISNHPEIARRLGLIAMNTALEVDIYGNVNSTHASGVKMMNGIGGSGDFARNASLTVFFVKSVAKDGAISAIVPFASHIDHTEHDTQIFISEYGVADVRGLCPKDRALKIIQIAHPDYRAQLKDYFERACKACSNAQTPHILSEAFSFHEALAKNGTMKF